MIRRRLALSSFVALALVLQQAAAAAAAAEGGPPVGEYYCDYGPGRGQVFGPGRGFFLLPGGEYRALDDEVLARLLAIISSKLRTAPASVEERAFWSGLTPPYSTEDRYVRDCNAPDQAHGVEATSAGKRGDRISSSQQGNQRQQARSA